MFNRYLFSSLPDRPACRAVRRGRVCEALPDMVGKTGRSLPKVTYANHPYFVEAEGRAGVIRISYFL